MPIRVDVGLFPFKRSDYEEMPLQNGRAIKATTKFQDESDSDWCGGGKQTNNNKKASCLCVNKKYFHNDTLQVYIWIFLRTGPLLQKCIVLSFYWKWRIVILFFLEIAWFICRSRPAFRHDKGVMIREWSRNVSEIFTSYNSHFMWPQESSCCSCHITRGHLRSKVVS